MDLFRTRMARYHWLGFGRRIKERNKKEKNAEPSKKRVLTGKGLRKKKVIHKPLDVWNTADKS